MDNPLISIISVNYNSLDVTLQMLDSLQKSSYKNVEVIVVDNNSRISPANAIHDLYPEIKVIESNSNLGFAGGNNLALLQAAGDFIFYLNNDTELEENCLETLINSSLQLPDLGAISPKFHYYHTKNLIEYAGYSKINPFTARNKAIGGHQTDTGQYTGLIETSYTHGGGMLIPRRVIDKTGPMAEEFFLYYEEMDWCERIKAAGYKIYCQRDTIIYHKESASIGRLNPLKTYYLNRSRILFMRRNYGGVKLIPFILFFTLVSVPKNVVYYAVKGQWDHLSAYFRSILWHFWPSRFTFKPVPSKN